jgi:hypothetical protein
MSALETIVLDSSAESNRDFDILFRVLQSFVFQKVLNQIAHPFGVCR